MPESLTSFDIVTLVLGIVGTVTGIGALIWNVAAFAMTGPRVFVEVTEGRTDGFQLIFGPGLWSAHPNKTTLYLPHRVVVVTATNKGRLPLTVAQAGIRYDNNIRYMSNEDANFRLEPHTNHTWRLPLEQASAAVRASRKSEMSARGVVSLATGKSRESKAKIVIPG